MPQVFYVQYEVRPLPDNEDFATAGGAYVNCYATSRERYLDDAETLESFDEAVSNGECYVYHLWPVEPQDDDSIP
jgi:hypothetical protein